MKQMNNEEIQDWLKENGGKAGDVPSVDVKTYQYLFDLLGTEPAKGLPYDFTAKVVRKVQADTKQRSGLRSYIISIAVVAVVVACIYGLFVLLKPQLGSGFLSTAATYKWVFIWGIFSFLTIQYLDQVLIKSPIFKKLQR